jgi:hypothetical protein
VVETLIIGDVESVVAGKIPVASTIPTTIGIVTPPDSLPSVLPTPRRKSDALEFDRPIYAARQNSKFTGEEIYASLFKPLYENKPYAISTLIKPVINAQAVNTEDARKIKTKRAVKAKPTKKQKAEKKSKTPSRSKKSKFY